MKVFAQLFLITLWLLLTAILTLSLLGIFLLSISEGLDTWMDFPRLLLDRNS